MRKKPLIFVLEAVPFQHDILVSCGASFKDAKKFVAESDKKTHEGIDDCKDAYDEAFTAKGASGYGIRYKGSFLLILSSPKSNWAYWDTVMHELHHIVEFLSGFRKFEKEIEAKAYLHVHLFDKVRKRVQEHLRKL